MLIHFLNFVFRAGLLINAENWPSSSLLESNQKNIWLVMWF